MTLQTDLCQQLHKAITARCNARSQKHAILLHAEIHRLLQKADTTILAAHKISQEAIIAHDIIEAVREGEITVPKPDQPITIDQLQETE